MRILLVAALALVPAAALAQSSASRGDAGFHARVYERYCAKLRESPEAYVQFVRRLQPVHGFTYSDFARLEPGAAVRAECGVSPQRSAEVRRLLAAR